MCRTPDDLYFTGLEKDMEGGVVKNLKRGLYEIYWKSGGSSLAAVGYDPAGNNWIAPSNWTGGMGTVDYWDMVKAYKMLIPHDYTKKTKSIKSDYLKIEML